MKYVYFITHPNVHIDPGVPVPRWSLSKRGFERMRMMLDQPWVASLSSIYCSHEQKAVDGADLLAQHLSLPVHQNVGLGENDRSSTGFLEPDVFEQVADQFFANPDVSIRDWETARDAQSRIVDTVAQIIDKDKTPGSIAVVSHGAVGTLLLCHYSAYPIDRKYDQPGSGGGNYFVFEADTRRVLHAWRPIDVLS